MMGLSVGDAIGQTLEFTFSWRIKLITDMVRGGSFGLEVGQWTDETSMALCLAESRVEQRAFDQEDPMRRYLRWYLLGSFRDVFVANGD